MIVKLNVGGRKFDTTEITLFSKGHNFLTSLLSSPLPSMRDDAGRLFIDRNGNMFEILLEYLRSGALHIPPHISAAVRSLFSSISVLHSRFSSTLLL